MIAVILAAGVAARGTQSAQPADVAYLSWPAAQAQSIGESAYKQGRVGGLFDGRLLKTERAYNYKLAATLFSRSVIRAAARLLQLRGRMTAEQTRNLVVEAEAAGATVVMTRSITGGIRGHP